MAHYRPLTGAIAAGVVLLAGCGGTSGSAGAPTATVTTPAPTASSSAPSPSAPTTTASTAPGACTSDIRVIPGASQGAAGHLALILVFNNVSRTRTCTITGYPGVDLVNAAGVSVAHLKRTLRGMAGGEPASVSAPQPVVLAPGASASALAEASDVPQSGITDCGDYSLMITVPSQYTAVPGGTARLPRCAAEIHPVVPGTGGGLH